MTVSLLAWCFRDRRRTRWKEKKRRKINLLVSIGFDFWPSPQRIFFFVLLHCYICLFCCCKYFSDHQMFSTLLATAFPFCSYLPFLTLIQIAWYLPIIVEVFQVIFFCSLRYHSTTAWVYLLLVNLVTCLVQLDFCFWYSTITSFTLLHSQIALLRICLCNDILWVHQLRMEGECVQRHECRNLVEK